MTEQLPKHHLQGELEYFHDRRHVQGELFQSAHHLIRLSSTEVAVAPQKEAKQDELDLFPEIQHLF